MSKANKRFTQGIEEVRDLQLSQCSKCQYNKDGFNCILGAIPAKFITNEQTCMKKVAEK